VLLRGLAKHVGAIVVAGLAGLGIGAGLAELSGDPGVPGGASPPVTNTTTTASRGTKRASTPPQKPANDVRVRIVSTILHPASSRSGKRRKRARLSVHVRVTNGGSRRIVPSRPVLVSGDVRVRTDPSQDTDSTKLGALRAGATGDVTLRFEIAGAVTERLREELRARLTIAGRNVTATVKVGGPVGRAAAAARRRRASAAAATATASASATRVRQLGLRLRAGRSFEVSSA